METVALCPAARVMVLDPSVYDLPVSVSVRLSGAAPVGAFNQDE